MLSRFRGEYGPTLIDWKPRPVVGIIESCTERADLSRESKGRVSQGRTAMGGGIFCVKVRTLPSLPPSFPTLAPPPLRALSLPPAAPSRPRALAPSHPRALASGTPLTYTTNQSPSTEQYRNDAFRVRQHYECINLLSNCSADVDADLVECDEQLSPHHVADQLLGVAVA